MIEIELNKIKKNYGLRNVLDGFSLELKTGEKVALIGQNGSGKSTILKIIAKQESMDSGTINIRNGAKIGILNQIYENEKKQISVEEFLYESFEEIFKIDKKLNKLEIEMSTEQDTKKLQSLISDYGKTQERFLLIGGYEIQEKFNKICSKFYINKELLKQNYNLLSGGEKTRINLAKLFLTEPDILLLDEPTNHLDTHSLEFLEELISKHKGTVLIVSHDRYFLDKVINKTVLLENGKENIYCGNYSYFLKEDERRTLAKFENYKNQQKQIEKMKESITTLRKFGELAGNEMFFKRAKNIEKRLEKMEVLDKVDLNKKSLDLKFNMENRSGNDVLKIENLEKKFEQKVIFKDANLILNYGEKVALIGENGSGKSTLINIILGQDIKFDGVLKLGTSIKLGYIPQNIIFEDNNKTVLDYFLEGNNFSETEARNKLARYGFRQENVFKKIGKLSGGEKVRIILMKLIQKDINFLILDEPTNHIDIDTREILEEALQEYKGTLLFVSHDRFFINALADRVLNIEDCKVKSYYGNYDNFTMNK
ncbi:MAG: ABC-F family ATP-binding cassette domain-containing protein [Clostridia bacterium]|nr:ABC-F family ATP-binding cassette domain-containing protein [Clostridia bacterium]